MRPIKSLIICCLIICGTFFLTKDQKPKYYVSACAIFRNEARFLKEWLEYHRLIGVDHFYLFNNLSEDDYLAVLKPYIDQGVVELYQWPYSANNQKEWTKIQCRAYGDIIKKKRYETFWLAIIDTDEFILPLEKPSLKDFLKEYEPYCGIGVNWQLYGTSGVVEIPKNKTLIGSLLKKAPENFENNNYIKSIVQPQKVKKICEPHYCKYKKPYRHVTENKEPFSSNSLTPQVSIAKIRINHYTYRDENFFNLEKKRRLQQWFPDSSPEMNPEYNRIEDPAILSYLPELEKRLFIE